MGTRELGNWLEAYLVYTAESRSPEIYHLWVGISSIATILRRRVFFDMNYFLLYPNLYIVLIGPAGRCKKSTATRIGKSVFSEIPDIETTADSTSRERLIQDMQMAHKDGQSALTAHSTEFASLLTTSKMDMVVWLTDIYDCPPEWQHKTKGGGTNKIIGPCLNLLAGTTPKWMATAMPLDTIGIGLTSRIIFVFADQPRIRPTFPKLSEAQKKIKEMLTRDLGAIAGLSGEYKFAEDAKKEYETWELSQVENPNTSGDPRLDGYFERKPMHVIKLAMIVAASRGDSLIISIPDLRSSMEILRNTEVRMSEAFSSLGKNPLAIDYDEVYRAVKLSGGTGMTFGQLMDKHGFSVDKEQLAEVLETLVIVNKVMLVDGRYKAIG